MRLTGFRARATGRFLCLSKESGAKKGPPSPRRATARSLARREGAENLRLRKYPWGVSSKNQGAR